MLGGGSSASPGAIDTPGGAVELLADADRPDGWLLLIDRVRQSYVDLTDPTYLDFEYTQTFASVVEAMPPGPLRVTHVGGGALSFPRYLAARRPGSSQIVLEPNAALTEFVRARLPLARGAGIRVRPADGATGVAALGDASADLLVLDAFHGARMPAELGTGEFLADTGRVLVPGGVLLANTADGPGRAFLRRFVAGVREVLPNVLLIADPGVVRGRRFGNVIVVASRAPLPTADLARAAATRVFPQAVVHGQRLDRLVAGAEPFTPADARRSPEPPESSWQVDLDADA